tara:strand:+ start:484 stop:1368 length:885 start_codon:yes stop_codon:yes gene_type:complete
MNNFKYQNKNNTSEEEMNSFKDFKKVLEKHKHISSAYKKLWKYSIISSAAAGILVTAYLLYPSAGEPQKEAHISILSVPVKNKIKKQIQNQNFHITPEGTLANPLVQEAKKPRIETVISFTQGKKSVESNFDDKTEDQVNHKELKPIKSPSKNKSSTSLEISNSNSWYVLNELPREEILKLPTLIISNSAWPKKIMKEKLIKSPSITTVYESINQEIPIVNGMAYITTSNSKNKPIGHKLNGNYFPPGLIREIHKIEKSCILLLKNIEILIPGRGRINIRDREIKINMDNEYTN